MAAIEDVEDWGPPSDALTWAQNRSLAGGPGRLSVAESKTVPAVRKTDPMITVYLDQMKWIDLARAKTGHPLGDAFQSNLRVFRDNVENGSMAFPLSAAHYYETGKAKDPQRRKHLAETMMELSRSLRIAPPHTIVPWEAKRALVKILEVPLSIPRIDLFGEGAAHAYSSPSLAYVAPESHRGVRLPEEIRAELQRSAGYDLEMALLSATAPNGLPDGWRVVLAGFKAMTDAKFVQGQNLVAAELKKLGRHRLDDVLLGTAVADIIVPLQEAARELGISLFAEVLDAGRMRELVEHMPSRWVEMKMRGLRHSNPQKAWHGNDLNDVTALAIAIPYCDVVVTERSWAAMLNAARVPQRFNTVVTSSLEEASAMASA